MNKRLILHILVSFISCAVFAQNNLQELQERNGFQVDPNMKIKQDSSNVEIKTPAPKLYMWNAGALLGTVHKVPVDTAYYHFQNKNLVEGYNGHYNYLGNLGSPRLSRLFFERTHDEQSLFMEPYSFFWIRPEKFKFTNSNIPYTNLEYFKAGDKVYGEERFKSYFSVNANKRLAIGFNIDYLYGRGYYSDQSTAFFNGALFASYLGKHYQFHAIYSNNNLKMRENGGIADDRFITSPEEMSEGKREYESMNIPTKLRNTWNYNHNMYVYYSQRYKLGFDKDSTFVPVTSFIHTFKIERSRRQFKSKDEPEDFYENTYLNPDEATSNDSTVYVGFRNTLGVALLEGFNKYAKAGLTAFATHEIRKYDLMNRDPKVKDKYTEQALYVGGELSKKQGKVLHYTVRGQAGVIDKSLGEFDITGNLDLNFKLFNDTVSLLANAKISNKLPVFYKRHYHSNHFWWDNDNFEKEFVTKVGGELNIKRWRSNLKVNVENMKNYVYFNNKALPAQTSENIQIISAVYSQSFKVGIFHLDNEICFQKSSNETILPLPTYSLYHNFYIETKLAKKVLSLQLGVDVRYFDKYYAPDYTPAIGQFHLQGDDKVEIGGYPIVNVYANFQLKTARFFVMAYHVNQSTGNYFLAPHYPINQMMFKFGLSWNFYD